MHDGEVGEHERIAGFDGLGLAHEVPIQVRAREVAREALFEAAVIRARLLAGGDGIARPESYAHGPAAQHAARDEVEAFAPGDERKDRCERAPVHRGVTKQREGPRYVEPHSLGRRAPDGAEEAPEVNLTDDGARAAVEVDGYFGREPEQALRQGEVRACCERVGIWQRLGRPEAPLSREICEQVLVGRRGGEVESLGARGNDGGSIEPPRIPGALRLDGDRVAERWGIERREFAPAQVLEHPDRHPPLAGRRNGARRFLEERHDLPIRAAGEPDEIVDQSAEPGVILRAQPERHRLASDHPDRDPVSRKQAPSGARPRGAPRRCRG